MDSFVFLSIIVAMALFIGLVVFMTPKKFRGVSITVIVSIVFLSFAFVVAYASSYQVRSEVNMIFHPDEEHALFTPEGGSIPLPPKTAFLFRFSSTGAKYITKTTEESINKYFLNICQKDSDFKKSQEDDTIILETRYQNIFYIVKVKRIGYSSRWELSIDVG